MARSDLCLFALESSRAYAGKVAATLGVRLCDHEEREFEDGEHKSRPLVGVRGRDVFVVQSLYSDTEQSVNDKLCRLLFFVGALKDASAGRINAVIPYLGYARKDRKTQPRDPVSTKYVAALLESVGTDRVLTLDVHNVAAFQNAFRCHTEHLEARKLFVEFYVNRLLDDDEVVVISPDVGGIKRAEQFRKDLTRSLGRTVSVAFMEKHRGLGVVTGETLVGDVKGRVAVIIDDLISTGGTIMRTAEACRDLGARVIYAAASHGLFVGRAGQVLATDVLEKVVVTDTIPPFRLDPKVVREKLVVLNSAPLIAEAIKRVHCDGSIVDLLEN